MKKNALLTFLFACIPGAGQMYYGYMQRGLSMISLFCAGLFVAFSLRFEALLLLACIIWMYSFFDVYDLIRCAAAGQPKADGLLLFGGLSELKKYLPQHNRVLGWIFIVLGAYGMYVLILREVLYKLLYFVFGRSTWQIINAIPGVIVSALFIMAGLWLLGLRPPTPYQAEDLPPYPGTPAPEAPAAPQPPAETFDPQTPIGPQLVFEAPPAAPEPPVTPEDPQADEM